MPLLDAVSFAKSFRGHSRTLAQARLGAVPGRDNLPMLMTLSDTDRIVLAVVQESAGRWDTRNLDFEYSIRSQEPLEPSILHVLRGLEARDLVEEVSIQGGTGPGWRLTAAGMRAVRE